MFTIGIFIVNNFYCVLNCVYINRVTIYRAKYPGIVTLAVLPSSSFGYKSEEKSAKYFNSENQVKRN